MYKLHVFHLVLLFGKPDLSQIMQADPSLSKSFFLVLILFQTVDGYRLVYERKCNFDLHLIDPEVPERVLAEVNRTEEMIVKILVRVSSSKYNETKFFRVKMKTITSA